MIIEFLPDFATWEEWNGNLVHFYGEEQFPFLPEAEWATVARAVAVSPTFDKFYVPDPVTFPSWQEWAKALITNVNGA